MAPGPMSNVDAGAWRGENAMWITRNVNYIETDDTSENSKELLPWQVYCIPQSG